MITTTTEKPKCRCGCGFRVNHPSSAYLPGHDATHVSARVRDLLADILVWTEQQLPVDEVARLYANRKTAYGWEFQSVLLQGKFHRAADRQWARINK